MSTPYNSSVSHPHPSAIYTPEHSLPPISSRYQPSPIRCCQSPLPMSKKPSSPKVISHQKDKETQTYLNYTPPPYPHQSPWPPKSKNTIQIPKYFWKYSTTPLIPSTPIPHIAPLNLFLTSSERNPLYHLHQLSLDQKPPSLREPTHPQRIPSSCANC